MFDRLSNRRLGTVLFDPHDEYFIPAGKATHLATIRLSRVLGTPDGYSCEKNPSA
jgi:hypothetical protein